MITGKPFPGPFTVSLENVQGELIDLPDGAFKRLRSVKPGIVAVLEELARSVPARGEEAGVSPRVYARIVEGTAAIEALSEHELTLEKLLEVVRESRKKREHDREHDIGIIVDTVRTTAQRTGDTALVAAFEQTIAYHGQIAAKAAQTRRKNAETPGEPIDVVDGND